MVSGLAAKAEALSDLWERWQHVKPRVFRDVDISPLDVPRYSLLLLGGPDANAVSASMARVLPLKVTRDSVTLDGRRFIVNDAVVQMLYPNPRNLSAMSRGRSPPRLPVCATGIRSSTGTRSTASR